MSAAVGGGEGFSKKQSNGGCVDLLVKISRKCGQGGKGIKTLQSYGRHLWNRPTRSEHKQARVLICIVLINGGGRSPEL